MNLEPPITIEHNLVPNKFMWLWAKYVVDTNLQKHCTACLKGATIKKNGKGSPYSQKFSKASNPDMLQQKSLIMDETRGDPFKAIYLCGVSSEGYATKSNYSLNLHAAVKSTPGKDDTFVYLDYEINAKNGRKYPSRLVVMHALKQVSKAVMKELINNKTVAINSYTRKITILILSLF